jgi:hypothetical protein
MNKNRIMQRDQNKMEPKFWKKKVIRKSTTHLDYYRNCDSILEFLT